MTTGERVRRWGSIFGTGGRRPAAPPRPAPASVAVPGVVAFLAVVDRLEIRARRRDVRARPEADAVPADMAEIGNRKRQGLLEMDRALIARPRCRAARSPEIRERLEAASPWRSSATSAALGTQLRAVREIADIIAQSAAGGRVRRHLFAQWRAGRETPRSPGLWVTAVALGSRLWRGPSTSPGAGRRRQGGTRRRPWCCNPRRPA